MAIIIQSYSMDKAMKKKGWTQNFVVNGEPIQDVNNHIFVLDHKATKVENVIKRVIKNLKKNETPVMEEYHDAEADF